MKIDVTINGVATCLEAPGNAVLLDVLRRNGYVSVKEGCRAGPCGACTVLVDGRPILSCLTMVGQVHGRRLETVEGLGTVDEPHPLQQALVDAAGVQCGFCTPGLLLSAKALLDRNPDPTDAEIARAIDGNLCRCTGYVKIIDGVRSAARSLRGES